MQNSTVERTMHKVNSIVLTGMYMNIGRLTVYIHGYVMIFNIALLWFAADYQEEVDYIAYTTHD